MSLRPRLAGLALLLALSLVWLGAACVTSSSPTATSAGNAVAAVPTPDDADPSDQAEVNTPGPTATASHADAERIASSATWSPGQLEAHFQKHKENYRTSEDYDQGARNTIRQGKRFTYQDKTSGAQRLGFYSEGANKFTGVTRDGKRITTHFSPDRGAAYVKGLEGSTYK